MNLVCSRQLAGIIIHQYQLKMSYKQYFFIALLSYVVCFIYYIDFNNYYPTLGLRGTELFRHFGYEGEEHLFVSEDGFQTKIHRLGHGGAGKKVFLLVPGIHCSSEVTFVSGPDHDIAYPIFSSGVDFWATNYRGNFNSQPTKFKIFTDDELTNFSFHEQGYYDLAAAVDYVIKITGQKKIILSASSMGSSIILSLLASRPEYNNKIEKIILFGPTGPFTEVTNIIQKAALSILTFNKAFSDFITVPFKSRLNACHLLCSHPLRMFSCWKLMDYYLGFNSVGLPDDGSSVGVDLMFTGPFFGIYEHFKQNMEQKNYTMRDFGKEKNLQKYGTEIPPPYQISNVKVPITIFNSEEDAFLSPEARKLMQNLIPNIKQIIELKYPFQHGNFMANGVFDKKFVEDVIKIIHEDN